MYTITTPIRTVHVPYRSGYTIVEEHAVVEALHMHSLDRGICLAHAHSCNVNASLSGRRANCVVAGDIVDAMLVNPVGHNPDTVIRANIYNLHILQNIVAHCLGGSVNLNRGLRPASRMANIYVPQPGKFIQAVADIRRATRNISTVQVTVFNHNVLNRKCVVTNSNQRSSREIRRAL